MRILLLGFVIIFMMSCASNKPKTAAELQQMVTIIETYIYEGKQQPTYTLSISNDHWAHYNGISRVDKLGTYKRLLTDAEYKAISSATRAGKIAYMSHENESERRGISIQSDIAANKPLTMTPEKKAAMATEIHKEAHKVIAAGNWASSFELASKAPKQEDLKYVADEILVSLKTGVSPEKILPSFSSFGLKAKRNISKNANYWLMGFDTKAIKIDALIELLKKDANVVAVSKNKILEERK